MIGFPATPIPSWIITMRAWIATTLLFTAQLTLSNGFTSNSVNVRRTALHQTNSGVCEEEPQIGENLPPVLQQIADERAEFHVKLGKAKDTLQKDMQEILRRTPGKSIRSAVGYLFLKLASHTEIARTFRL